jgi:hypothetical protein
VVGFIRYKFGKVNCVGCNMCDRSDIALFMRESTLKQGKH